MQVFGPDVHRQTRPQMVQKNQRLAAIAIAQGAKNLFEHLVELRMIVSQQNVRFGIQFQDGLFVRIGTKL